ncbi:MAG: hypothetical protein AAGN35_19855 [Bacteroidota bacterium]
MILGLVVGELPGQLTASAPLKRKWYDGAVRLLRGGDGNYYLIRSANGQYWSFGRNGLFRFEIWKFDSQLKLLAIERVGKPRTETQIGNAFEVLPAPEGIAVLNVARSPVSDQYELRLCQLQSVEGEMSWNCRGMAQLEGFVPRAAELDVRTAGTPDSNFILVTWRNESGRDRKDNATGAVVLDQNLRVVHPNFAPFRGARREFRLLRIGIVDRDHLLFWVKAYAPQGVFGTMQPASFHLLEYHVPKQKMREIRMNYRGDVLMDVRFAFAADGSVQVAGWWLNGIAEERKMGVYFAEIGKADSLANLKKYPFQAAMRHEMLPKVQSDGDAWYRPNYQSCLLPADQGFVYALHLHGALDGRDPVRMPGTRYDNVLVIYDFDAAGELQERRLRGWCNEARTDYYETYSWLPVRSSEGWMALATDFSRIPTFSQSHLARNVLIPLENESGEMRFPETGMNAGGNWVLAPRLHWREGPRDYVFVAKSRKYYRLLRLQL